MTHMSKIFEPMEEETAMSPNPFFLVTTTEVIRMGLHLPAASSVSPIT